MDIATWAPTPSTEGEWAGISDGYSSGFGSSSHVVLALRGMGQITTWIPNTVDKLDPIPGLVGEMHPLPTPYIMSITPVDEMIKG